MTTSSTPDVSVDIADLVLVRRPGESLEALVRPLADELASWGVPEAEATATGIIDGIGRWEPS